jgi:hypothetical protein
LKYSSANGILLTAAPCACASFVIIHRTAIQQLPHPAQAGRGERGRGRVGPVGGVVGRCQLTRHCHSLPLSHSLTRHLPHHPPSIAHPLPPSCCCSSASPLPSFIHNHYLSTGNTFSHAQNLKVPTPLVARRPLTAPRPSRRISARRRRLFSHVRTHTPESWCQPVRILIYMTW